MDKALAVYLYLKMYSSGKLRSNSWVIQSAGAAVGIKDPRTVQKQLDKLRALNWIGYNQKTGIYFIRSFDYIRHSMGFKRRQATTFTAADFRKVKHYLAAAIICKEVDDQRFYFEVARKRKLRNRDAKEMSPSSPKAPAYYGLTKLALSRALGCSESSATRIKQAAAKAGYIEASHRYRDIHVSDTADYSLRLNLAQGNRVRCWKKDGKVKFVEQLMDHIVPKMQFKTITKFNNLKLGRNFSPLQKTELSILGRGGAHCANQCFR